MTGELVPQRQIEVSEAMQPDPDAMVVALFKDDPHREEASDNAQLVALIRVLGHRRLLPHEHVEINRVMEVHEQLKKQTGSTHAGTFWAEEAERIASGRPQTTLERLLANQRFIDPKMPIVDVQAGVQ